MTPVKVQPVYEEEDVLKKNFKRFMKVVEQKKAVVLATIRE